MPDICHYLINKYKMKLFNYLTLLVFFIAFSSCSEDNDPADPKNEIADLIKVQELSNDTHIVELYTSTGIFFNGYNNISIRIKNKTDDSFIKNASLSWKPIMHMTNMMHSCPKSDIKKVMDAETLFNGFLIFQMPGNDIEGWELTIDYTINGTAYQAKDNIDVEMADNKLVSSFTGTDQMRYILAYIQPEFPEVKVNDASIALYKMDDMMHFSVVPNFTIKLDPRMPSMGNHSSPNNEDFLYNPVQQRYDGKLSLTMTGLWRLNLMLLDENDFALKGTEVTEANESSDLYLEIEF